jgi:hypothetical protein
MSYHVPAHVPLQALPAALGDTNKGLMTAGFVALGVGLLALIAWGAYWRFQTTRSIAEKHGVGSALAFEGGMAAIGALASNEESG